MKRSMMVAALAAALVAGPFAAPANAQPLPAPPGGGCWPAPGSAAVCISFLDFLRYTVPTLSASLS